MNRKEQIENLKNEIALKQQSLNQLQEAEDRQEPDEFYPGHAAPSKDLTQEDIADILRNI